MKIKLSIIVLSYNTRELLRGCLESIEQESRRAKEQELEIIVVDNGSTDGSVEMLKEWKSKRAGGWKLNLIFNQINVGFAKGNNQGIKEAKGEYIMLLNSDTIVKPKALELLTDYLDRHPGIAIVGPKLLNNDGSAQASCGRFPNLLVAAIMLFKEHFGGSRYVRWSPDYSTEVDWLVGAAFLARKAVFETIGGLDEKLFMYMEEVEWFYRARKAGFRTYFLREAGIIHLGRGSSTSGKREPILNIYRGLIYFYHKHKNTRELFILRLMLKLKAAMAYLLGLFTGNNYLKETYGKAWHLA